MFASAFHYLTHEWHMSQSLATTVMGYLINTHYTNHVQLYLYNSHAVLTQVGMDDVNNFMSQFIYSYEASDIAEITNHKYPLGSNDVYDAFGDKIPEANLSLRWDGEHGIYEKYAKDFIYWKNEIAKAVTLFYQPVAEDLFFDFSKKQRVNGIDYLFDEMRFEIRADGSFSLAEVDAWSC